MNQDSAKRKLTAIFSADVVGYSRLMEADESWTIKCLEENKKLMSSLIEEHSGRVVDSPGDNLLAEFSSVINAVECAVKVQEQLNTKNSKLMEDNRMHFRIGVNLGDVVEEEGRIYGNGVNIAARLEGLAEPGGICISGTAYDQVISKLNLKYDYLGEHNVKNIAVPVRAYRVVIENEAARKVVDKKSFLGRRDIVNSVVWIGTAVLITAIIVGVVIWNLRTPEPPRNTSFYYELPEGQQFNEPLAPDLAVSPDGRQFVYASTQGLYIRSIDELGARFIDGTDNDDIISPFFSPDGKWIAYFSGVDKQLKKINIAGGSPIPLCDVTTGRYVGDWEGEEIIFVGANTPGIMQISDNGGTAKLLIEKENELAFLFPQLLPNGKSVLFTKVENNQNIFITVRSLETGEIKEIIPGYKARYLPTGHLVYSNAKDLASMVGDLFAVPFDIEKLEVTGEQLLMVENISGFVGMGYALSDTGTLVYVPAKKSNGSNLLGKTLVWIDRDKKIEELTASPKLYLHPKISPDGKSVAMSITDTASGNQDIWIWEFERKNLTRLTTDEGYDFQPIWTPDGKRIVFTSNRNGTGSIYQVAANATGDVELLCSVPGRSLFPYSWSSDGKTLVMGEAGDGQKSWDISILSMEGKHERTLLLHERFFEVQPQVSPDGHWLAYSSDDSGQQVEVYLRPFPDVDKDKIKVSTNGGHSPRWASDGYELLYLNTQNELMTVSVEMDSPLKLGTPKVLFGSDYVFDTESTGIVWDIHPDGKRFLMMKTLSSADAVTADQQTKIIVVTNWFEELKKRVPAD